MHRLIPHTLVALFAMLVLGNEVFAQFHGSHERENRERKPGIEPGSIADLLAGAMELSHNAKQWKKHEAVKLTMKLTLGDDDTALKLTGTFATKSDAFVLCVDGTPVFGHDGSERWHAKPLEQFDDAAAHVHMLGMVPVLPYRIRRDDHIVGTGPMRIVNDHRYYAASIAWPDNDNWSVLLVNPSNDRLSIVAYFVRLSEDDEPDFSQAYAMVADDFEGAEEVPFARTWDIWKWSRPRGIVGDEAIGRVKISEVKFIEADEDDFAKPKDDEA